MLFRIDDAGFDDGCVTGMTFWQLCTQENTPQHNALSSGAHTRRHNRKCGDFYASCRLLPPLPRAFSTHGFFLGGGSTLLHLFLCLSSLTHTHTQPSALCCVACEADKGYLVQPLPACIKPLFRSTGKVKKKLTH